MFKIVSLILLMLFFYGCNQEPRPAKAPALPMPPSTQLEKFDQNWPPKYCIEDCVDISDLKNQFNTNDASQENQKIINRIPFPVKEYKKLSFNGNSVVYGKIAVQARNGRRVVGSNARLYLNPYTSYSKQWFKENYMRGNMMNSADDRLYKYLKFTTANDDGNFIFKNIPKGKYYLVGSMMCARECGFDNVKNIRIVSEISVDSDGTVATNLFRILNN
ncbi:MAG: carboxypeptidase regulatory-like domain-containing protein [Campylobacterales bacterium]|nr:carboxypeptidase regulatory-like domain-containing protein [Campylobacterales bacterium]